MDSSDVRLRVFKYLRYKRQCGIVVFERGLWSSDKPDILAVTKSDYLIEVEIKVTLADYRADQSKYKWRIQERCLPVGGQTRNRRFYYAAPTELAEKIMPELRPGCGLMAVSDSGYDPVWCRVPAPINKGAQKLTPAQIAELVRHQTGTLASALTEIESLKKRLAEAKAQP